MVPSDCLKLREGDKSSPMAALAGTSLGHHWCPEHLVVLSGAESDSTELNKVLSAFSCSAPPQLRHCINVFGSLSCEWRRVQGLTVKYTLENKVCGNSVSTFHCFYYYYYYYWPDFGFQIQNLCAMNFPSP